MRTRARIARAALAAVFLLGGVGCREEGGAERAGREIDEAIEDLREGGEEALEKLGRDADDDEAREAAGELKEKATEEN